jgi:hypothetical protein
VKVIFLLTFWVSCVWMCVYLPNVVMLFLFAVTVQGMCAIRHILLVCLHAHRVFLCCIHPANSFVGEKMLSFKTSHGILLPVFWEMQDIHAISAVGNRHLQEDYMNPVLAFNFQLGPNQLQVNLGKNIRKDTLVWENMKQLLFFVCVCRLV